MKLIKTIVASVLVLGMGSAFADEPVALTETQMDNVTSGGIATAGAIAIAAGVFGAATLTKTATAVINIQTVPTEGGQLSQDATIALSHSAGVAL